VPKNINALMEHKGCCPPGSEPYLKNTFPQTGTVSKIGELDVYRVGDGKKTIICLYDIFGFDAGRTRSICDELADAGYSVVMPDFFKGDKWAEDGPIDATLFEWVKQTPIEPVQDYVFKTLIPALEQEEKEGFAYIGFCWGVWAGWKLTEIDEQQKFKLGLNMHPSLVIEGLFNREINVATERIRCAEFIAAAGHDQPNVKPDGELVKILEKNNAGKIYAYEFPEMVHGWVNRGDLKVENVKRDYDLVMKHAKELLNKYL